jgi:hypothetical protein
MLWKMLTHVHISSTLCEQVGGKGEVVVDLEKEKGEKVHDQTMAAV